MKQETATAGKTAKMTATFNKDAKQKFSISHRKENNKFDEFAAIVKAKDGRFIVPVTLRTYYTASGGSNTACIWVNGVVKGGIGNESQGGYISAHGSGSAGGYGYHRPSAAAEEAINNAGFKLSEHIDGRGDSAIETAVKAIAMMFGHKEADIYVHKANG